MHKLYYRKEKETSDGRENKRQILAEASVASGRVVRPSGGPGKKLVEKSGRRNGMGKASRLNRPKNSEQKNI